MTDYKPYFLKGSILPVTEGIWTNTRAKLDLFKSWRAVDTNAGEVTILETWRCEIDQRDSEGKVEREFNIGKEKEFEVPARLLDERRQFVLQSPDRFAAACEAAQRLADEKKEAFGLWQLAIDLFNYRQLRFIEPENKVLNVFYPNRESEGKPENENSESK